MHKDKVTQTAVARAWVAVANPFGKLKSVQLSSILELMAWCRKLQPMLLSLVSQRVFQANEPASSNYSWPRSASLLKHANGVAEARSV